MIEASPKINIVFKWFSWHFFDVPKSILKGFWNFLLFNISFFSIGFHIRTFFSHWRRFKESYGRGFDAKRYFQAFSSNLISRIMGAFVRTIIIVLGLLVELLILLLGVILFLIWLILPILIIFGFWHGIKLLT